MVAKLPAGISPPPVPVPPPVLSSASSPLPANLASLEASLFLGHTLIVVRNLTPPHSPPNTPVSVPSTSCIETHRMWLTHLQGSLHLGWLRDSVPGAVSQGVVFESLNLSRAGPPSTATVQVHADTGVDLTLPLISLRTSTSHYGLSCVDPAELPALLGLFTKLCGTHHHHPQSEPSGSSSNSSRMLQRRSSVNVEAFPTMDLASSLATAPHRNHLSKYLGGAPMSSRRGSRGNISVSSEDSEILAHLRQPSLKAESKPPVEDIETDDSGGEESGGEGVEEGGEPLDTSEDASPPPQAAKEGGEPLDTSEDASPPPPAPKMTVSISLPEGHIDDDDDYEGRERNTSGGSAGSRRELFGMRRTMSNGAEKMASKINALKAGGFSSFKKKSSKSVSGERRGSGGPAGGRGSRRTSTKTQSVWHSYVAQNSSGVGGSRGGSTGGSSFGAAGGSFGAAGGSFGAAPGKDDG
ncbi:hypothetical protein TeGR_g3413, partial [Tetraparma gracilis]